MHNNAFFGACFYSAGIEHGDLHQSFVTTSRETHFILRAHTGICVGYCWHRKSSGDAFETKNEGEWTGKVEISNEDIPDAGLEYMTMYWPAPGFKGKTFELWVLNRRVFNFCVHSTLLRHYVWRFLPTKFVRYHSSHPFMLEEDVGKVMLNELSGQN